MIARGRKALISLFVGDLAVFYLALWLTLVLRYWELPSWKLWWVHLAPFSLLFVFWLLNFFIFDLYRRPRVLWRQRLANTLVNVQLANSLLAVLFFYFIPYLQVTPKTNLFINLLVSLALILFWRLYLVSRLIPARPEKLVFACRGPEVEDIKHLLVGHPDRRFQVVDWWEWQGSRLGGGQALTVVINPDDAASRDQAERFYSLIYAGVNFIGVHQLYEDLFERIPLSLIGHNWFLTYVSNYRRFGYRFFKRLMDVTIAILLGILSLVLYLPIALAIKLTDGGPIFYTDERIGQAGRRFLIYKFRSMSLEPRLEDRRVTWVGQWLRRTRLDELPQLWSVIRGDQSLIGPRPERPEYVAQYRQEIPYYDARHLVAPGLSGWAQLYQEHHPHFQAATAATREKLSYDLYYLKNRSWWLDVKIALKTVRALLSRTGI